MILKTKTLAAVTAIAVSGILGNSAFALSTQQQKIQDELQKTVPNAVLEAPTAGQVYATDAQFAAAVLAVTKEKNTKKKLSVSAAVQAALELAIGSNAQYKYASTTILQTVVAGVASNSTKLTQAVSGAFVGFSFSTLANGDTNSAAADLVGTALLGLKDSGITKTKTVSSAINTIVKTAIKGNLTVNAGSTVGAAAQYSNLTSLARLSSLITTAVSKAADNYQGIAQAVATAAGQIFSSADLSSGNIATLITDAVVAGYGKDYTKTHNGKKFSGTNKSTIETMTMAAVNAGFATNSGAGAAGLANYTFNNLQNGPVTDIYGL